MSLVVGSAEETDWVNLATGKAHDDDGLFVKFEIRAVQDEEKSDKAGRPIFEDREYIRIVARGDKTSEVFAPVEDKHRARFAKAYQAFKSGHGDVTSGTPLAEWPQITRSMAEELAYFKIRTVEDLASVSDGNMQNIGPLLALRAKAKDYVELSKKKAPLAALRTELDKKDAQIAALTNALKEQGARLEELEKAKK